MPNNQQLDDNSLMPFGKYKGDKMQDVPADYLLFIYENNKCTDQVRRYIEKNLDVIKEQIKQSKKYS